MKTECPQQRPNCSTKKILVIDDEEKIGRIYALFLSEEGFQARSVTTAQEATRLLVQEPFDLILLDLLMPGVNGKMMHEIIRIFDPQMKIIISSVRPIENQMEYILGAAAYHDKAQGVEALLEKIKEVFDDNPKTRADVHP